MRPIFQWLLMVALLMCFTLHEKHEVFETATAEQLIDRIHRLDGIKNVGLMLAPDTGNFFVWSSVEGRMRVTFTGIDGSFSYLVDKSQTGLQRIEFTLDNCQVDDWPIRQTVSKETAMAVAIYFLEHHAFPIGLDWEGNSRRMNRNE